MRMTLQMSSPSGVVPIAYNVQHDDHERLVDLLKQARKTLFSGKGKINYTDLTATHETARIEFVPAE